MEKIAKVAAVVIALIALFFNAFELRGAREDAKKRWTYELIKRFNDPEVIKLKSETIGFLRDRSIPKSKKLEILKSDAAKDIELKETVMHTLNLFEDMGYMYNRGLLDKDMTKTFFQYVSIGLYSNATWVIDYLRKEYKDQRFYG